MASRGGLSGLALAEIAAGVILAWSGIQNASIAVTLRSLLGGRAPQPDTGTEAISGASAAENIQTGSGITGPEDNASAAAGDTAASSPPAAANQALARSLAVLLGHPTWVTGQQWADWASLWNQESGWSTTALNPSSGATGIPQLNPGSHTVPAGWSSATVQITWGINYIASTYGSPSAAWAHEEADGWY